MQFASLTTSYGIQPHVRFLQDAVTTGNRMANDFSMEHINWTWLIDAVRSARRILRL